MTAGLMSAHLVLPRRRPVAAVLAMMRVLTRKRFRSDVLNFRGWLNTVAPPENGIAGAAGHCATALRRPIRYAGSDRECAAHPRSHGSRSLAPPRYCLASTVRMFRETGLSEILRLGRTLCRDPIDRRS